MVIDSVEVVLNKLYSYKFDTLKQIAEFPGTVFLYYDKLNACNNFPKKSWAMSELVIYHTYFLSALLPFQ